MLARTDALPEADRVKPSRLIPLLFAVVLVSATTSRAGTEWLTDYKKAQQQAKETKKLLLVNFTGSDWCPPCIMLQKEILSTPEFQEYASKNLVLMEADFPRRKAQPKELAAQNQELAMQFGIEAFPSVIIFTNDGKAVGGFRGYDPGMQVKSFIEELEKLRKKG